MGAFDVKRSDGLGSAVKVPRLGKWFTTYGVFGRAGEDVYTPATGATWDAELGSGAKSALRGLWPLQVGNKASFGFQEKNDDSERTWKLSLEVTGTENLVLNNLS